MHVNPQTPEAPLDYPVRIFLVDDQPLIRRGLTMLFSAEPDLQVCGEAGAAAEAMSKIEQVRPDLAVVDLILEEGDTFELIAKLRRKLPGLGILVFSMNREPSYVVRAMRAGADNYISKDGGAEKVVRTIRELIRSRKSTQATLGIDPNSPEAMLGIPPAAPVQSRPRQSC
jgi:DNA-binding NarL/FixJ family response regulator